MGMEERWRCHTAQADTCSCDTGSHPYVLHFFALWSSSADASKLMVEPSRAAGGGARGYKEDERKGRAFDVVQ